MGVQGRYGGIEDEVADDGVEHSDAGGRSIHLCGGDVCDHQADCGCLCFSIGYDSVQLLIHDYWDGQTGHLGRGWRKYIIGIWLFSGI